MNAVDSRLGHVAVVPITGASGPELTHVRLTADSGLTRHDEPYADVTSLQAVDKARLQRRRGLLAPSELAHVEARLRIYLGICLQ